MRRLLSYFKFLLFPFTLIYASILSLRNFMFDRGYLKSTSFDLPIISVGNISVGGTGKTPHTEYLIKLLQDKYHLASLSRGYKRESKGFVLANANSNSYDLGDEPMQMNRKFPKLNVAVDADRVNGVQELLASEKGLKLDCILLDDAYQHRYIKPGLSILLIDYNRPIATDLVMPMGRLRERAAGKKRADIIIMSKCPIDLSDSEAKKLKKSINPLPHQELYFTSLDYAPAEAVFNTSNKLVNLNTIEKEFLGVLLVTGIANPAPLRNHLKSLCDEFKEIKFPDHYTFKDKDIERIETSFINLKSENKIIITTEKDAVRFLDMKIESKVLKDNMAYIPLQIKFQDQTNVQFDQHIHDFVKNFKHNH
ncbi:tetraacyldisaccharide 4'-kinase [Ancylomarina euxinus]|uniref:Tetraacyldisaccharide 4'-kinase n=1 Tax=Ancylomarina euxinus TaxID=2283627 RepID=A0A425Y7T0_9BACT|nr:tetraacyldisaccharide 4'-kinase [Ancylomarina euxinus]MCZ4693604.1 tetraacyldisaccharide 4'-kinase [Ancylomarina euxinus]MUP13832.1 tetraacyldisaccharide 4'-kinase [Ancylomarina euxinus]RRG24536.1 tetraacyldisaccharide 4'-kinase [Ancylomarina euxinus]